MTTDIDPRIDASWAAYLRTLKPPVLSSTRDAYFAGYAAARANASRDDDWLPIDTAPRDGRRFLAYTIQRGWWEPPTYRTEGAAWKATTPATGHFASDSGAIVTHWRPLPHPPVMS